MRIITCTYKKQFQLLEKFSTPTTFPASGLLDLPQTNKPEIRCKIFTFLINNTADLVIESQIHHQNPHPKSP